jgi:hypothetical protein
MDCGCETLLVRTLSAGASSATPRSLAPPYCGLDVAVEGMIYARPKIPPTR